MNVVDNGTGKSAGARERTNDAREVGSSGQQAATTRVRAVTPPEPQPAAGAHAAHHLTNHDLTPGAGVLPSHAHTSGKEVDGGAG